MAVPFETSIVCPVPIGRTPQLDTLDRLIGAAHGGSGRTALIAGGAGIGKSRLVAEAALRFRARHPGALALQSRCFEPDRVLPYAALLDLLRSWLAACPPSETAAVLGHSLPSSSS
jgi:predicted ATPase